MRTRSCRLPILGLACGGGGALTVERALSQVEGVRRAYVNPATETAYVEYDADVCRPVDLARAVAEAGYRSIRRPSTSSSVR